MPTFVKAAEAPLYISEVYLSYYHKDHAPIPRKIVHESTDKKGRFVYTVHDCVLCNRTAQGFMTEKLRTALRGTPGGFSGSSTKRPAAGC